MQRVEMVVVGVMTIDWAIPPATPPRREEREGEMFRQRQKLRTAEFPATKMPPIRQPSRRRTGVPVYREEVCLREWKA